MHVLEKFRPVQAGSLCPNLLLLAPDFPLIRVINEPCYLVAYAQCYMITRTSVRTGGPEPGRPLPRIRLSPTRSLRVSVYLVVLAVLSVWFSFGPWIRLTKKHSVDYP